MAALLPLGPSQNSLGPASLPASDGGRPPIALQDLGFILVSAPIFASSSVCVSPLLTLIRMLIVIINLITSTKTLFPSHILKNPWTDI